MTATTDARIVEFLRNRDEAWAASEIAGMLNLSTSTVSKCLRLMDGTKVERAGVAQSGAATWRLIEKRTVHLSTGTLTACDEHGQGLDTTTDPAAVTCEKCGCHEPARPLAADGVRHADTPCTTTSFASGHRYEHDADAADGPAWPEGYEMCGRLADDPIHVGDEWTKPIWLDETPPGMISADDVDGSPDQGRIPTVDMDAPTPAVDPDEADRAELAAHDAEAERWPNREHNVNIARTMAFYEDEGKNLARYYQIRDAIVRTGQTLPYAWAETVGRVGFKAAAEFLASWVEDAREIDHAAALESVCTLPDEDTPHAFFRFSGVLTRAGRCGRPKDHPRHSVERTEDDGRQVAQHGIGGDQPVSEADARRREVIAAVRELADWLEQNPDVPTPNSVHAQYSMHSPDLTVGTAAEDQIAIADKMAKAIGAPGEIEDGYIRVQHDIWHAYSESLGAARVDYAICGHLGR